MAGIARENRQGKKEVNQHYRELNGDHDLYWSPVLVPDAKYLPVKT